MVEYLQTIPDLADFGFLTNVHLLAADDYCRNCCANNYFSSCLSNNLDMGFKMLCSVVASFRDTAAATFVVNEPSVAIDTFVIAGPFAIVAVINVRVAFK